MQQFLLQVEANPVVVVCFTTRPDGKLHSWIVTAGRFIMGASLVEHPKQHSEGQSCAKLIRLQLSTQSLKA